MLISVGAESHRAGGGESKYRELLQPCSKTNPKSTAEHRPGEGLAYPDPMGCKRIWELSYCILKQSIAGVI